jgi:hypothetical protein
VVTPNRSETLSRTFDGLLAVLDDGESDDTEVLANDAATDALALALALSSGTIALVSLLHQDADAAGLHYALAHREAFLIVASSYLEDVACELLAEKFAGELVAHALVEQSTTMDEVTNLLLVLVVDGDGLLSAVYGITDVELRVKQHAYLHLLPVSLLF